MIAILHDNDNRVFKFIHGVISVKGNNIEAIDGASRGVGHKIRVVDDYPVRQEDIETGRFTLPPRSEEDEPEEIIYTRTIDILELPGGDLKEGDIFNPADLPEKLDQLPKTEMETLHERTADCMLKLAAKDIDLKNTQKAQANIMLLLARNNIK